MRVLLGGVPLGTQNIGDEAVMEAIVTIIRKLPVDLDITVSTYDPAGTAERLGVKTCPLLGFEDTPGKRHLLEEELNRHDAFIWSGASGLSDYPYAAVEMCAQAKRQGKKVIVFCTGMDRELNPNEYRILWSRRRKMLDFLSTMTGEMLDFVSSIEQFREEKLRLKIGRVLSEVDLVVVRDEQSHQELLKTEMRSPVYVGADPSILIKPLPIDRLPLDNLWRLALLDGTKNVGLGICAHDQHPSIDELAPFLDRMIEEKGVTIFMIPMNPVTDVCLMREYRSQMRRQERVHLIEGLNDPQQIAGLAAQMDLVVSTRFHLLTLSSIGHVPMIGIARGHKIDSFLTPFGYQTVGNIEHIDFDALEKEMDRLLVGKKLFHEQSQQARIKLLERLEGVTEKLSEVLLERVVI